MEFELFFHRNKSCPSCGSDAVVAMHEQCISQNTGNWYSGCCGKLCLHCGWSEESSGRQAFGMYTGKYCYPEWVELDDDQWDYDAVDLIMQMKHCDGNMDVGSELKRLAKQRKAMELNRKRQAQADKAARDEFMRRQREAEAENQRRQKQIEEAERKRAAEELKRLERQSKAAASHVERGKAALKSRNLQTAVDEFYKARELCDTPELSALIAEVFAISGNSNEHADIIISELGKYFLHLRLSGEQPTIQQYLWMAQAYLDRGDKNSSCTYYFYAGNIAYANKDYVYADRIYREAMDKTTYYVSADLFKVAYAHSCAVSPITAEDHRFCIDYYIRSVQENHGDDYARGNLTYHFNAVKEYRNSVDWGLPAAQRGDVNFFYNNLATAYFNIGQYDHALHWYKAAENVGLARQSYNIACCLEELGEYDDAKEEFQDLLYSEYDEEDIYEHLLNIAEEDGIDDDEIAEYRVKLLELNPYRYEIGEWLRDAVDKEQESVIEDMLYHKPDLREELFEYVLETAWFRYDSDKDIAKWRIELLKIDPDRYERKEWLHEAVDKELENAIVEMLELMPDMRENLYEYVLATTDRRGDSDTDIAKWRIELLKIDPYRRDREEWLKEAKEKQLEDIVREMLELMPDIKQREEDEARIARQREEARIAKQREEEELLLLLMM